jgi:hypothetical protein
MVVTESGTPGLIDPVRGSAIFAQLVPALGIL